jgi:hypothetical protein
MNASQALQLSLAIIAALVIASPLPASPECSDSKVRRMAERGDTVAAIAEKCAMDEDDVQYIIEAGVEKPPGPGPGPGPGPNTGQQLLGSGSPVGDCGCWGFVDPNYQQPHPRCQSGFAVPRMCSSMCPAGGYAWQGVCK